MRVTLDFGLGDFGFDDGVAVFGVHSQDAPALAVEVADDVAGVGFGHGDIELDDGFQQYWRRLAHTLTQGLAAGNLEGDGLAVHRMGAAVVDNGFQVHHREAGQDAFFQRVDDALFHRRNQFPGHPAAHHFVAEFKPFVPRHRLQPEQHMAILAAAAGLLLVAVLGVGNPGDGFAVRNHRQLHIEIGSELALDTVKGNLNLHFAKPGKQAFAGFRVAGEAQAGVVLHDAGQGGGHFVQVGLAGGNHRQGIVAMGEIHAGQSNPGVAGAQGIAGEGDVQLAHGANVAGRYFGNVLLAAALREIQLAQALGLPLVIVVDFTIGLGDAAEHAEHRQLAHEGVGGSLEHQGGNRAGRVRDDGVIAGDAGQVGRRRQKVAYYLRQFRHADVLRGGSDQNGYQVAVADGGARPRRYLGGGDFLALQVLVGQGVIGLGYRFDEAFAGGVKVANHAGGDVRRRVNYADRAGKVLRFSDGQLERHAAIAESGLQFPNIAFKAGIFPVHFVQDDGDGQAAPLRQVPRPFGAYINAGGGGHQNQGRLNHAQRGGNLPGELVIARRVQQVDFTVPIAEPQQAGLHAGGAAGFFRLVVGHGVAVLNPAHAVYHLGVEQHNFGKGSLARAAMGQQRDIADGTGGYGHRDTSFVVHC